MLKITNLQKTFNPGTVNAKTALSGLNLTINDGDFVTVIGGNGAGKSTLMNAIAGVWKPDYGTIEVDGIDVTVADQRAEPWAVAAGQGIFIYRLHAIQLPQELLIRVGGVPVPEKPILSVFGRRDGIVDVRPVCHGIVKLVDDDGRPLGGIP